MAERIVSGKDILLFIDPAGGTDYSLMVCLTSNGIKRATSIIDAASKCGPASTPGPTTISIDFAGQVVFAPDAERISEGDLHDLLMAGTIVGWKMGPAVPVVDDVIYSGTGFIATLDSTYDLNGATFSGTMGISGTPTRTEYAGS